MTNLTPNGRSAIADIARRYSLSEDAVEHMARAVSNGGGTMAQFNIPELGGSGQWMAGGMTMVGDMFNNGLQNTVANLCGELSNAMASVLFFERPTYAPMNSAWPEWLGQPASSGGQNSARYAYFPQARRLAFDYGDGRDVVLLDTGDHQIGGFSQQQSGPGDPYLGVSVSSQFGQYALSSFPLVGNDDPAAPLVQDPDPLPPVQAPATANDAPAQPAEIASVAPVPVAANDILETLERLAHLRDMGALSEDEFSEKKSELLSRL